MLSTDPDFVAKVREVKHNQLRCFVSATTQGYHRASQRLKRRPRKALRPDVQLLQNDESPVISDGASSASISVHR
jgi:hypothetical protein